VTGDREPGRASAPPRPGCPRPATLSSEERPPQAPAQDRDQVDERDPEPGPGGPAGRVDGPEGRRREPEPGRAPPAEEQDAISGAAPDPGARQACKPASGAAPQPRAAPPASRPPASVAGSSCRLPGRARSADRRPSPPSRARGLDGGGSVQSRKAARPRKAARQRSGDRPPLRLAAPLARRVGDPRRRPRRRAGDPRHALALRGPRAGRRPPDRDRRPQPEAGRAPPLRRDEPARTYRLVAEPDTLAGLDLSPPSPDALPEAPEPGPPPRWTLRRLLAALEAHELKTTLEDASAFLGAPHAYDDAARCGAPPPAAGPPLRARRRPDPPLAERPGRRRAPGAGEPGRRGQSGGAAGGVTPAGRPAGRSPYPRSDAPPASPSRRSRRSRSARSCSSLAARASACADSSSVGRGSLASGRKARSRAP